MRIFLTSEFNLKLRSQIDYQISIYASPAIDLIYALYYSLSADNRQNRRAEFISTYYKQFVESLKDFGYLKTPPSLIDLQVEILRNGSLEVIVAICMSIFFFVDFAQLAAMGVEVSITPSAEARKMMYQTPGFKETILKELPRWLHNGSI